MKQSKLKIKGFGIDPNSCEVVTVVISSFMWHLNIGSQITPARFFSSTALMR
jgi:hypothetical protein